MSISGVMGGGLDVQGIVSQLMYAEQEPIRQLQTQQSKLQKQATAYDGVTDKLNTLLETIDNLKNSSSFGAKSVSSSNSDILTATATSAAVTGKYDVVVSQLATTDTYESQTFASATDTLTAGTFDLSVGSGQTYTITLDTTNNTLSGLQTAINNLNAGVKAVMVHDNSGYRLALMSETSGTDGAINLSNFSDPALETQLGFSQTVTLQDAAFTVNGISLASSSNQAENAIEGMTLNLAGAASGTHVTLSVENDTETVTDSINSFVDTYNSLVSYLNQQFTYDSSGQNSSPLAGDSTLRRIQDQLLTLVSQSVTGLDQNLINLRQIGIEMQNDGTLSTNSTTLEDALTNHFDEVQNLFQDFGFASDSRINYITSSSATQAGTYSVNITTAAEQADAIGANTISTSLAQDETLTIDLNGTQSVVNLTAGLTLSQIISTINQQAQADGLSITARNDGSDHLEIYSNGYGSSQQLSVVSSTDAAGSTGFGTAGMSDTGVDVAGTIDGVAAVGSGQTLTGGTGTAVDGLMLKINVDAATVGTGLSMGTISVSRGYADLLHDTVDYFTDTINGPIILAKNSLNSQIQSIDDQILAMEDRLQTKEELLINQFTLADQALRNMSSIQSSLSQQVNLLG